MIDARLQRMERDVSQLKAVLNAMREYAAMPDLEYSREEVRRLVAEAIRTVEGLADATGVEIINRVDASFEFAVSRTRIVQALSNVLHNAVEAYSGVADPQPVEIDAQEDEGAIVVCVRDHGCGMIPEAQTDARTLFTTEQASRHGFRASPGNQDHRVGA